MLLLASCLLLLCCRLLTATWLFLDVYVLQVGYYCCSLVVCRFCVACCWLGWICPLALATLTYVVSVLHVGDLF